MKIYTKTGDDGSTGLLGGLRVSKASPRVEAYGSIDELNAVLGWAGMADLPGGVAVLLREAQSTCFRIGAILASAPGHDPGVRPIDDDDVARVEAAIDELDQGLPPLKQFLIPGGSEAAARLHLARTVARRAERSVVTLGTVEPVAPVLLRWINRLSDYLFVAGRAANAHAGQEDVLWSSDDADR